MSDFDSRWLDLREPADHAARARSLVGKLCQQLLALKAPPELMDIGCGTGSTYRYLSSKVPTQTKWKLLDRDDQLLSEAEKRIGRAGDVEYTLMDLAQIDKLPLETADYVTASALFDLCSAGFCNAFAERLAHAKVGLYAALNYDGTMEWSQPHPLDSEIIAAFNRHQQTDKGFGSALGPDATAHLQLTFESLHYRVTVAMSPWILNCDQKDLQQALISGMENPIREMATLSSAQIRDWLNFRLQSLERSDASCRIGHTDLLAIPRGQTIFI